MRILFVTAAYDRGSGLGRHSAHLAHALARRGHAVTVLTRRAETTPEDDVLTFQTFRCAARPPALMVFTQGLAATRAVRRLSPDFDFVMSLTVPVFAPIVHIGMATHRSYYRSRFTSLRPTTLRGWLELFRPLHLVVLFWEWRLFHRPHPRAVVVAAEQCGREYPDQYDFPAEKVSVVPLGVSHEEFAFDPSLRAETRARLGLSPDCPLALSVATSGGRKGIEALLDAIDLLPTDREWRFAIAGNACHQDRVQSRTRALRDQGRVMLLGSVPSEQIGHIRDLYCAADLLVFPSLLEGWGMPVTEALACGLPVLTSANTPSSIAIRRGENGDLLQDPRDPREIRDRALALLDQSFDRESIARSVAWLSWDSAAEQLEQLMPLETTGETRR